MEKIVEQALLYDFYGEMLTGHQKEIYEDFVLNDLSLGEIAKEREITRQGVHDIVKRCNAKLVSYEEKLHLLEKFLEIKQMVEQIHRFAENILENQGDAHKTLDCVQKIESISTQILEEL